MSRRFEGYAVGGVKHGARISSSTPYVRFELPSLIPTLREIMEQPPSWEAPITETHSYQFEKMVTEWGQTVYVFLWDKAPKGDGAEAQKFISLAVFGNGEPRPVTCKNRETLWPDCGPEWNGHKS